MEHIIKFNLPEDADQLHYAINGIKYSILIDRLDDWLRSLIKYKNIEAIKVEDVRNKITELTNDLDLM